MSDYPNEAKEETPPELVTLLVLNDPWEAQIIRGVLANYGIVAVLASEAVREVYGITIDGLGEIKVQVREEDEAEARDILEAHRRGDIPLEETD